MLQWGRGLSTAEMFRGGAGLVLISTASMGPRSFNRGNEIGAGRPRRLAAGFNGAAVFQPRK